MMMRAGNARGATICLRVSLPTQVFFDVFLSGDGPWILG